MRAQHLGERPGLPGDLAAIAGKTAVEIREAPDSDRVVVAPGQQRGARGRTHRRCVEAGIAQAVRGETVDRRRFDRRSVATEVRKADIIEKHDQNIRRACRRRNVLRPPGARLVDGRVDVAAKCCVRHRSPPWMPAALMIGHHLSISAFCQAPSAAADCWSERERLLAEFGKPRLHGRIGQGFHDRSVEQVEHGRRGVFGSPNGLPGGHVETGQSSVVHGR